MKGWHTKPRLIHEKDRLKSYYLNINNGIFFCIALTLLSIELKNTDFARKIKKKPNKQQKTTPIQYE